MASRIHWVAPATIVGALLAGVALALGHHLFYASLNKTTVSPDTLSVLGSSISRQELNIAAGTALAFLAKASFVLSVSVSFMQLFWAKAKSRPKTLANLDHLYSALGNLLTLSNLPLWWAYPLLLVTAVAAWYVAQHETSL